MDEWNKQRRNGKIKMLSDINCANRPVSAYFMCNKPKLFIKITFKVRMNSNCTISVF